MLPFPFLETVVDDRRRELLAAAAAARLQRRHRVVPSLWHRLADTWTRSLVGSTPPARSAAICEER